MLKYNTLIHPELKQLSADSWQQIQEGSKKPDHALHNMTVANRSGAGLNIYTVVLRGVNENEILFYTDVRSEKVTELQADHAITALFYDPEQQRQFIITGEAVIDHQNALSLQHWQQAGYKGRKSYLAGQPPSAPLNQASNGLEYLQGKKFDDGSLEGYQNFAVITIRAAGFEYLQLSREQGNRRARFQLTNGEWSGTWVIP